MHCTSVEFLRISQIICVEIFGVMLTLFYTYVTTASSWFGNERGALNAGAQGPCPPRPLAPLTTGEYQD